MAANPQDNAQRRRTDLEAEGSAGRRPPSPSLGRLGARHVAAGRGPSPSRRWAAVAAAVVLPGAGPDAGGSWPCRCLRRRLSAAVAATALPAVRSAASRRFAGSCERRGARAIEARPPTAFPTPPRTLPSRVPSSARGGGARSGRPFASPAACSRGREERGAASEPVHSRACGSAVPGLTVAVARPWWSFTFSWRFAGRVSAQGHPIGERRGAAIAGLIDPSRNHPARSPAAEDGGTGSGRLRT
jgi:hypothetical protein